eukprot:3646999-Pyramimonas_sp.AAC.1
MPPYRADEARGDSVKSRFVVPRCDVQLTPALLKESLLFWGRFKRVVQPVGGDRFLEPGEARLDELLEGTALHPPT